jgi:hypothetical protein
MSYTLKRLLEDGYVIFGPSRTKEEDRVNDDVTSVILSFPITGENDESAFWDDIAKLTKPPLLRVDQAWKGITPVESQIFIGAFDRFDIDGFRTELSRLASKHFGPTYFYSLFFAMREHEDMTFHEIETSTGRHRTAERRR